MPCQCLDVASLLSLNNVTSGGPYALEEFIMAVFCCIEALFPAIHHAYPGRQRGFAPRLADSEVLTMETVGAF